MDTYIKLLAAKIEAEKALRAEYENVLRLCPHKIGDKVKINGYAYRGQTMVVDRISMTGGGLFTKSEHPFTWKLEGHVLKKNGKIGAFRAESREPVILSVDEMDLFRSLITEDIF